MGRRPLISTKTEGLAEILIYITNRLLGESNLLSHRPTAYGLWPGLTFGWYTHGLGGFKWLVHWQNGQNIYQPCGLSVNIFIGGSERT